MDELQHHGVKGMKWGVRKDRNRRARIAANLDRLNTMESRRIERLKETRAKNKSSGKSTRDIDAAIKKSKEYISNNKRLMKKATSDLTRDEIDRGRRYVNGVSLGGVIGGAIKEIVIQTQTSKYSKEN